MRTITALCLLALFLSGCGAARTAPADTRYYTLEYEPPSVTGLQTRAVIVLPRFGVAPEFNTSKLVYRDLSFGRQEYVYHQWRAAPQALAADYLRRDLQASGLFLAVGGPSSTLPSTHRLEGMVEEWMEIDGEGNWLGAISLTLTLVDLRADSAPEQVVFQRTYRESEPSDKKNPGSVVEAMSRVMRRISAKVIADVYAGVKG